MKTVVHIGFSGLGGVSDLIYNLGKNDRANKHLFFMSGTIAPPEDSLKMFAAANVPTQYFPKKRGLDLAQWRALSDAVKKARPDVVIAHGFSHLEFCLVGKPACKIVCIEHQNFNLQPKSFYIRALLLKRFVTRFVFTTEESQRLAYLKFGMAFKRKPFNIIPNPLDTTFYAEDPNIQPEPLAMMMSSRLTSIKDHPTVFRAMALLKHELPIKFYITGDGETRPALEALVAELGLGERVVFCGVMPQQELQQLLQKIPVYIQSSLGETLSMAIIGAMAMRKVLIGSDVSGINNLIAHGKNGLLFTLGDEASLAEQLRRVFGSGHHNDDLRTGAFASAQEYLPEKVVESYHGLINL